MSGPVVAIDERSVLGCHLQGDMSAFAELVQHFRRPVYAYLVRCGVDPGARDDLFQEVFINIHLAAASFRPERRLAPWVFTIVSNCIRTHFRKQRVRELVFTEETAGERPDTAPASDDMLTASEMAGFVEKTLLSLPLMQREAVLLCVVERMSEKEAAEILDVPLGTLKTSLHRARAALARALARRAARERREVSR